MPVYYYRPEGAVTEERIIKTVAGAGITGSGYKQKRRGREHRHEYTGQSADEKETSGAKERNPNNP